MLTLKMKVKQSFQNFLDDWLEILATTSYACMNFKKSEASVTKTSRDRSGDRAIDGDRLV